MPRDGGTGKKRGGKLGFWFFRTSLRLLGISGTYGFLYFVCFHYLIFDSAAVSASMAYMRKRFPNHSVVRMYIDVYRLFINQGKSLIDRYYAASGHGKYDARLNGYDRIQRYFRNTDRGLILLTAHIGNWQFAMTALRRLDKTVHLLMRPEDNEAVKSVLNIDSDNGNIKIISSEGYLSGVIEAMGAVYEGEIVSIMGDRPYEYKTVQTVFLGSMASFPIGAFTIAAAAKCPIVVLLSAKTGKRSYLVDITNVIELPDSPRGDRDEVVLAGVRKFAGVLEKYVEEYPYQWFVFEDLWQNDLGDKVSARERAR